MGCTEEWPRYTAWRGWVLPSCTGLGAMLHRASWDRKGQGLVRLGGDRDEESGTAPWGRGFWLTEMTFK